MGYLIINAVTNETLSTLNARFSLRLIKEAFRSGITTPKINEFDKYKTIMENNLPVEYECIKD